MSTDATEETARRAAAKALTDAADAWTHGEWANTPRRADIAQDRLAAANHVGDWLRARARTYETPESDGLAEVIHLPLAKTDTSTPDFWRTELGKADSMEEALGIALGAVSTCWTDIDHAGTFESADASAIVSALLELIRSYVR